MAEMRLFGRLLVIWGVALPLIALPFTVASGLSVGPDPLLPWFGRQIALGAGLFPYRLVLAAGMAAVAMGLSLRACACRR